MPTLTVYRGDQFQQQLPLGEGVLRIGRAAENDLVLPDDTKGVSRSHAEIRFDRGQYLVADLNSQNGVWLGTRRVRVDPLPPGMPLTIGPYSLVLEVDAPGGVTETDEGARSESENTEVVLETVVDVPQATVKDSPPPAVPQSSRRGLIVYGGSALALIVSAVIVVIAVNKPRIQPPPDPSPNPAPKVAPVVNAQLEGHYTRAAESISAGDKGSALRENEEAAKLAPGDKRIADQRAVIDAMSEEPAPPPPTEPDPPTVGGDAGPRGEGRGGPPLSATLRVARRGTEPETPSQRAARQRNAVDDLREGLKALSDERFAAAKASLQAAINQSGRQDFGTFANEARDALQKANEALERIADAEQRKRAQQLVDEAQATVASDLVAAVRKLKQARADYPEIGFSDLLNGWLERARVRGEATMGEARNYAAFKKNDRALALFEDAVTLLELVPGGHPGLAEARRRVQELKGGR